VGLSQADRRESKRERERERETDVIEGKGFSRCYHNLYTCIQVFNEDLYESYFYIRGLATRCLRFFFPLALLLRLQITLLALLVFSALSFILGIVHAPPV